MFASEADDNNVLDRAAFNRCFHLFLSDEHSHEDAERHRLILSRLFDVFDVNGDGTVDFTELSTGLSVLCGGSKGDKIRAACALYGKSTAPRHLFRHVPFLSRCFAPLPPYLLPLSALFPVSQLPVTPCHRAPLLCDFSTLSPRARAGACQMWTAMASSTRTRCSRT